MKMMNSEKVYQICIYLIVGILVIVSLFPLIYVAAMSLTSQQEFLQRGNMMIIPYKPTLEGYKKILFENNTYIKAFGVSVVRVIVGVAVTMSCSLFLGYLLSKEDLPGRKVFLVVLMITVLYGSGLIPTFMTVKSVGLMNNFWVYIIPGMVDSWSVLVFRQFFAGLPKEVFESAEIDGCGEFRMLIKIVLPMSTAVLAALGLFCAVGHWNQWFDALIYMPKNKDLYPLQLLLRNLFNSSLEYAMASAANIEMGKMQNQNSLRMVVTMVGTVPILCIYPFLQKYFVTGVFTGAVKG